MVADSPESMWRRGARLIWRSLRVYPALHATAMAGALSVVAASIGGAFALGWATDDVIVPAFEDGTVDGGDLWIALALIVGAAVVRVIGIGFRRWFLSLALNRTQRDWRRDLVSHYLDVPLRFHRERPTGELLAHSDNDLSTATMVLGPLAFAVSSLVLVGSALVTLFVIHPYIGLVGLVLFPILITLSRLYTARVEGPSARVQQMVGDVSSVAHESFEGALVVKTLGRQDAEVERMRQASARLRDERILVGRIRAAYEPLAEVLPAVGVVVLLLIGAWLVDQGEVTTGDLVLGTVMFGLLNGPLRVFAFFLEELPQSVVALERVDRVMEAEVESRLGTEALPEGPLSVSVSDLVVSYGDHRVLDGVSLEVPAGTTMALVGATGSGKSTLVESIAGLLAADEGGIEVGGVALADAGADAWSDAVVMAFQESFLFSTSITENVTLGATTVDTDWALRVAQADGFVAELPEGLDTVVGERGTTLSGGQRQRVALARGLARRPQVLLLDDATSAVDPVIESEILGGLAEELDTTVLVVAHRLSTIGLADQVAYFDAGRVVAVGTHDELLQRDDYRALVTAYEQGGGA